MTGAATAPAARAEAPRVAAAFALFGAVGSSTSVFHSRQAGHCPCHRAVSLPHSRQKNAVLVFAIALVRRPRHPPYPSSARRVKFSKRVNSLWNIRFTVPVAPFRCLPMMTSARPSSELPSLSVGPW